MPSNWIEPVLILLHLFSLSLIPTKAAWSASMFDTTLRYLNLIILPHPVSIIHVVITSPREAYFRVLIYLCLNRNFEYMGEKGTMVRTRMMMMVLLPFYGI